MPELKELRTQIGYELDTGGGGPDKIPRGQLKQLYGAISSDIQAAAKRRGPAAANALAVADFNYGTRMRVIDAIQPLIQEGVSAEGAFRTLNTAARGGNASLLRQAQKTMRPDEWRDVGATIISRLGEPTPGTASAGPFSISSYATNWNKLSGPAKDALFGPNVPDSPRSGMETLARVAGYQQQVARLANVSHSGEQMNLFRIAEVALAGFLAHGFPIGTATGVGTAYGAARALMSPGFTKWIYGLPVTIRGMPSFEAATQAATLSLQRALMGGTTMPPQRQRQQPPAAREERARVSGQ
jgi:hypothetical protein